MQGRHHSDSEGAAVQHALSTLVVTQCRALKAVPCAGALAGAAAVVFSMPADCIKTQMELGSTRPPSGLLRGSAAFFRTGRTMWADKGARSMFIGMTPRLLENVPSTMFYWVLVAALRRALKPWTADGDAVGDQGPAI